MVLAVARCSTHFLLDEITALRPSLSRLVPTIPSRAFARDTISLHFNCPVVESDDEAEIQFVEKTGAQDTSFNVCALDMCYCSGLLSTQAFRNVPVLSSFSTPCKGHLTEPFICASAFSVTPQRVSPYSLSLLVRHGMAVAKGFFLFFALLLTQIAAAAPQAHDHGCPDVDEQSCLPNHELPIHYPDPDNDDHQSGPHPCFEADAIRDVLQPYPVTDPDRSCPKKPGDNRFSFRQKWLAWMVCYRDDSN